MVGDGVDGWSMFPAGRQFGGEVGCFPPLKMREGGSWLTAP